MPLPLVVFDTNILMDVLFGRDPAGGFLLQLAENGGVDLIVPEFVLKEFRGTALRWIASERTRVATFRTVGNNWARCQELGKPAETIAAALAEIDKNLIQLQTQIEFVIERAASVASVAPHTQEIHFRGDLRYLAGYPPDRPVDGLKDCRIFEAVLDIARRDQVTVRKKFFVTKDSDFDSPGLAEELKAFDFEIRKDAGRLYGELL